MSYCVKDLHSERVSISHTNKIRIGSKINERENREGDDDLVLCEECARKSDLHYTLA